MWVLQSPGETRAHHIDWTDWLETDDGIATAAWEITPNDGMSPQTPALDYDVSDIDVDDDRTTVRVSGLTRGQVYTLRGTITTDNGETGTRDITIRCDYP